MTAEIAVMNQSAVALAADSAATMSGTKIFAANKIFALSKYEPVAVMVYGSASCMQVPWETVIKEFREHLGDTHYARTEEYGKAFLQFIASNEMLFPESQQEQFAKDSAAGVFSAIRGMFLREIREEISNNAAVSKTTAAYIVRKVIEQTNQRLHERSDRRPLPRSFRKKLRERYGSQIDQAIDMIFEKVPLNSKDRERLADVALDAWCKDNQEGLSGVVFAGFGREEIFPSVTSYEIDGILLNEPIFWAGNSGEIDYNSKALILGFAQADMIYLFIEGVTPQYERFVEAYFEELISGLDQIVTEALPARCRTPAFESALVDGRSGLLANLGNDLGEHRRSIYIDPMLSIVASLPKDELGGLAESLVSLTSLKRRVSLDDETVGGPIDVAVISRGDGLIWVKRKHYFERELNHHFFANYYRST